MFHNRVSNNSNNNNKSVVLVTHKADVSINRLLLVLLFLLWRFTRTHKSGDVLCTILCILGHTRVNNNNNNISVVLVTHQADFSKVTIVSTTTTTTSRYSWSPIKRMFQLAGCCCCCCSYYGDLPGRTNPVTCYVSFSAVHIRYHYVSLCVVMDR